MEKTGIAPRPSDVPERSGGLTFREVIVPLDGSPHAEHALPWAIQIATLASASVRLVHVHPRMHRALYARRVELYQEFDRLLREPKEQYLADVIRRVARASAVAVKPSIVDGGNVSTDLPELVAATDDIVVMATRGRTVFGRALVGSSLDAALQRRHAPILHVRGYRCPVDLTARPSIRHALVPLDGSSESAGALQAVSALNKLASGRQTLLTVIPPAGIFGGGDEQLSGDGYDLKDKPVAYLDGVAKAWRPHLPELQTSVVWSDASPAREILAQAEDRQVDFIAMATRPRSRLSRLLRPGVFDRLLRQAKIPILVVKQL
jgi:nucleotide-binding universal stress UspA family protein